MTSTVNHTLPRRMSINRHAASNRIPRPASRHDRERHGIHRNKDEHGMPPREPHSRARPKPFATKDRLHHTRDEQNSPRRKNHAPLHQTTRQRPARRDNHNETPSETTRSKDETIQRDAKTQTPRNETTYETTSKTTNETPPPPPRIAQENGRSRGYENATTETRTGSN